MRLLKTLHACLKQCLHLLRSVGPEPDPDLGAGAGLSGGVAPDIVSPEALCERQVQLADMVVGDDLSQLPGHQVEMGAWR